MDPAPKTGGADTRLITSKSTKPSEPQLLDDTCRRKGQGGRAEETDAISPNKSKSTKPSERQLHPRPLKASCPSLQVSDILDRSRFLVDVRGQRDAPSNFVVPDARSIFVASETHHATS